MQFGYADGLVIRGNTIRCTDDTMGIYVWGTSRYNPAPSKRIVIENNTLDLPGQPISLNGVEGGTVKANKITKEAALAKIIASLLYGVTPWDPSALVGAPLLLTAVAFVATWLPARRASRVEPIRALRVD